MQCIDLWLNVIVRVGSRVGWLKNVRLVINQFGRSSANENTVIIASSTGVGETPNKETWTKTRKKLVVWIKVW